MPYKNIEDKRKNNREGMKRWRSNPENLARQKQRRKELRQLKIDEIKKKEHEYYENNKSYILKRSKEYQARKPEVRRRAQEKAKVAGKGIMKGKKEREILSPAYISAQIRKEKTNKSIEKKQSEILIYRLKKAVKKYE